MGFYDAIRVGASGAASAYEVERSLRFNPSDSPNLARTFGTSTNVRKRTLSLWVKRSKINDSLGQVFFEYFSGGSGGSIMFAGNGTGIGNNDEIHLSNRNATSGSGDYYLITNNFFRDPSAWYHLVLQYDTTQSTASDRIKLYVNGSQASFSSASYPSQNYDSTAFLAGTATNHNIGYGYATGSANYFGGYLAEINFIDGQALTPASFGETDAITGQWNPIKYTGSYGNQGFYLNFSDNSGTTATTLGKDSSGNDNNFTPNNFSVSAGAGNDSVEDTPTNNFPTFNLLDRSSDTVLYNGNLRYSFASRPNSRTVRATFALPSTGKYYWEFLNEQASSNPGRISMGVVNFITESSSYNTNPNSDSSYMNYSYGGGISIAGSSIGVAGSWYNTERAAIAVDCDTGKFWFGKVASNGSTTWYNSTAGTDGNPATGANPTTTLTNPAQFMPFGGWHEGGSGSEFFSASINFGQQAFLGTPPTDYKALNSANLPDPTILLPNEHFDTLLWSGNATTSDRSITGLNFQPDWAWTKTRNHGYHHALFDSVRGANNILNSDQNFTENYTNGGKLASFDAPTSGNNDGGITWDYGTGNNDTRLWWNVSGKNYLSWNWNAGDTDGKTYVVKVVSDSGNKYRFDDFGTSAVTLDLAEGGTYIFNMDDSSNASHPFSIGTAANGTVYTSGITYFLDGVSKTYSEYTSGFSSASTRRLHITVPASAPQLYYWCSVHSGMGGAINTNSTLGSSNFDGAIQSTAKVNATAGFSIVTYTGTGSNTTVGHGLGVKPDSVIVKRRTGGDSDWFVFHKDIGNTKNLRLNLDNSQFTTANIWNNTDPTSSVVNIGFSSAVNGNGSTYVMYCFSSVVGYSKFGSYTGNGSSDGPFVFTGFRPAWVMIRRTDSSAYWVIHDSKRDLINPNDEDLYANRSDSTVTTVRHDFLSNGFKLRSSTVYVNANNSLYVYLAFAESPFKNARAR